MTKRVKIKNTTMERDLSSKAILATDRNEYTAHLRRRDQARHVKSLEDKLSKIVLALEKNGINVDEL